MKKLLALLLMGAGWLALRRRQAQGGQVPTQALERGKAVLSKVASDVRSVSERASSVASNVQRSGTEKAEELRSRLSGTGSGTAAGGAATTGLPTTEQPPDDSMLVGEAPYPEESFPYAEPPEASPSIYAAEVTGPEDTATPSGHVPEAIATDDMPDPLTGSEPQSVTRPEGSTLIFTAGPGDQTQGETFQAPTEEIASFPDTDVDAQPYDSGVQEVDSSRGDSSVSTEETQPLEGSNSPEEGLLLEPTDVPRGNSYSEATSAAADSPQVVESPETVVRQEVESTDSASQDAHRSHDRNQRIEGGSGEADRIYDDRGGSVPGSEDTEDTARELGRPGPVADARREDLRSTNIAPASDISSETYQNVEVSLPPETLAAMQNVGQGAAHTVDFPIHEGFKVEAADGSVGEVASVARFEGGTDNYMVVKEGLLFKTNVNIPFSAVDRVEGDTVYLNIDKQYVKLMEGQETPHVGDVHHTL